ncbi:hypothetical protein KY092_01635 [Natronomonas gomsonensis]|jgi:hypothetical protein|uniref:hypothetical protein n=1 Tax=Natronomonas gomsonensis TaxID=1046043 RepID=UPI0020CA430A|nr:hypothetical protein [Natronomonas gomsonensis]MCY4729254.1 hypothetical protein [Natronomonas gomsonensis]
MRRRTVLAALAAGLAGCSGGRESESTPTVTPVGVPEDTGGDNGPLSPTDSRFDADTPTPEGVRLFHQLSGDERMAVEPNRELFTAERSSAQIRLRNDRDTALYVSSGWGLRKYTGSRWVRILAPHINRGGLTSVDPNSVWRRRHNITNVFSLPVLGPGLYARIEDVRVDNGEIGGESVRLGALFEVSGTDYEVRPAGSPRIDGDVATLVRSPLAERTVVFERVDDDPESAVPVVPEVIGAIPMFRDTIPLLSEVRSVRINTASAPLVFQYLSEAPVRAVDVGPETRLEHDGTVFTVRTVDSEDR